MILDKSKKVFLKKTIAKNIKQFRVWDKDPEIIQFREFIWGKKPKKLNNLSFAIFDKKTSNLIGDLNLDSIDLENKHCGIGITIGNKDYWGKGFGEEAIKITTNYCFKKLGLNKVYLDVWEDNKRAIKCYQKCGFKYDGILRQHVRRHKKYHNKILMSLLKREWKG